MLGSCFIDPVSISPSSQKNESIPLLKKKKKKIREFPSGQWLRLQAFTCGFKPWWEEIISDKPCHKKKKKRKENFKLYLFSSLISIEYETLPLTDPSTNGTSQNIRWRRKWQPTPVLLPENPMDGGAW